MRRTILAFVCLAVCSGAQCMQQIGGPKARSIEDAPPGSIVGQCARDGTWLIIDTCENCKAACDFKMEPPYLFRCVQCGQTFSGVSCYRCKTNTHVSSGRFKLKEKAK